MRFVGISSTKKTKRIKFCFMMYMTFIFSGTMSCIVWVLKSVDFQRRHIIFRGVSSGCCCFSCVVWDDGSFLLDLRRSQVKSTISVLLRLKRSIGVLYFAQPRTETSSLHLTLFSSLLHFVYASQQHWQYDCVPLLTMAVLNYIIPFYLIGLAFLSFDADAFQSHPNNIFSARDPSNCQRSTSLNNDQMNDSGSAVEEYKNAATKILSNFMEKTSEESETVSNPIDSINFDAPKFAKVDLDTLAQALDYELYNKEWFVTGNVNPIFFSEDFEFQDPDVKLSGIEDYARGVYKLFDQETARAEIISTIRNETVPNTITCTWRLSGKVSIGPGLTIKPYLCYTDFTVDEETGLILEQEDRFDIPGWDILLSATLGQLFPPLIGTLLAPPAPPVEPREPTMPSMKSSIPGAGENPIAKWIGSFTKQ